MWACPFCLYDRKFHFLSYIKLRRIALRRKKRVVRNRERLLAGQLHCLSGVLHRTPKE